MLVLTWKLRAICETNEHCFANLDRRRCCHWKLQSRIDPVLSTGNSRCSLQWYTEIMQLIENSVNTHTNEITKQPARRARQKNANKITEPLALRLQCDVEKSSDNDAMLCHGSTGCLFATGTRCATIRACVRAHVVRQFHHDPPTIFLDVIFSFGFVSIDRRSTQFDHDVQMIKNIDKETKCQ